MKQAHKALKHSKKGWAVRHLLIAASIISTFVAAPAQAGEEHTLTYDVYAGGIHALEATLDIDMTKKDRYSTILSAHTRGLLGKLAPWSGSFETKGWRIGDKELRPEMHKSISHWRDEEETKEYSYDRAGNFKSLVTHYAGKKPRTETIEQEIADNTIDVLSATLMVMENVNETGACAGESMVFDGKRRFKMTFRDKGADMLKPVKYNVFEGPAVRCTVEVEPAGGRWHKKPRGWLSIQEQGRDKGTMPTVWMAQLEPGGPAVPIKVLVKTDYGAFYMQLAQYEGKGDLMVASIRED